MSVRIPRAVAAEKQTVVNDLSPLHDVVDPDAIDTLYSVDGSKTVCLSFRYEETHVRVAGDGHVDVTPLDSE
ncbi:HalOD1 output domain-containing protein [Halobaculum marinum]|uniref:HalOD1 output domain-containing protein n=1 Tax=Halobaculum marinum TaxID=3031996 RepID=A0ABD5WYQ2_9EURY|nr:HalOD1 output domain-containing protein [Halobaculum sp. DT55]